MVAHLLYVSALSTNLYVIMRWFYFRTRRVYRTQMAVILFGSLGIPVAAILYSSGVTPFDLTPFALAINGIVVWIALFRYDFLDVVPLAADLLVEEMGDAVVVTGSDGEVLDANEAARLLGGGESPVGRPLEAVAPPRRGARRGGLVRPRRGGRRPPDVRPERDEHPRQYGIERGRLIVLHDVTDQIRRQAALERQNERLDQFASVVSHDLRNPIAVAEGTWTWRARTGRREPPRPGRRRPRPQNALVDDLLTLARTGQSVDTVEPVRIESVVETAWESVDEDASLVNAAEGRSGPTNRACDGCWRTSSATRSNTAVRAWSSGSAARPTTRSVPHGRPGSPIPAAADAVPHK